MERNAYVYYNLKNILSKFWWISVQTNEKNEVDGKEIKRNNIKDSPSDPYQKKLLIDKPMLVYREILELFFN